MTEMSAGSNASDELTIARRRLTELQAATLADLRAAGEEQEQVRNTLRSRDEELTYTRAQLDETSRRLNETSRRLEAVTGSRTYRLARQLRLLVHPVEAWRRWRGGAAR